MHRHGFAEQIIEAKADVFHHHKGHKTCAEQQQYRFDDLHPRGGEHAAKQHVHHHQHADQHHRDVVVQAEQQFDQLACAHHLGDQIQRHHHQRTARRQHADRPLLQTIRSHVRKGVFTEVTQAFRNQEQDNRPAHQEAQRVDQPVVAGGKHQRRNPEKRRRRHIVARNRQAVLKTGDVAARRIIIATGAGTFRGPVGDP